MCIEYRKKGPSVIGSLTWHVSEGLGVQILERASEIDTTLNFADMQGNCDAWSLLVPWWTEWAEG
ncbi:hypothetical protein BDZ45DRAFT_753521 [Acephala macrosclerotiorum]|nr:hypothetical protein BDZ45DRAFT_753521 [Acephala macrosclerotiorum]